MVTAGVSPRMMAQKAQVAGISREPTAVPFALARRPKPRILAAAPRDHVRLGPGFGALLHTMVAWLLAQRGVLAGGGDPEPLLRDADALDLHPGRELRDAEREVRQDVDGRLELVRTGGG